MKTTALVFLMLMFLFTPNSFADDQNETAVLDAVGTIGYRDDFYFTVVLKTDFSPEGDLEIGFKKTEELQLPPMVNWAQITPGLAVRVTYEEIRSPERAKVGNQVSQWNEVLDRRAIKLVIGQKPQRKALAS